MVTGLLDTNILVDVLRNYPPAIHWFSNQQTLGVAAIVWLELLNGVTNSADQRKALKLLRSFVKIDVIPSDFEWSIEQTNRYKLSHNIGSIDCLIASVSYRLQLPLYTTNLKHFKPLLGNLAQKPY